MNFEEILQATQDRRSFLALTLGSGIGMLTGHPTEVLAQDIPPTVDNDSTPEHVLLADQIRKFYLKSINAAREEPTWEEANDHWMDAEALFNKLVDLETQNFIISHRYPYYDLPPIDLSKVSIDLKKFENEERKVTQAINSGVGSDVSSTARLIGSKIVTILLGVDASPVLFEMLYKGKLIQPIEKAILKKKLGKSCKSAWEINY